MTTRIAALYRYPIKAVGREEVGEARLIAGQTFPGDRLWAVAHEAATVSDGEWSRCMNFVRAASSPALMAVSLRSDADRLHLSHPDRPDIALNPVADAAALIDWLAPLIDDGRARPARVVTAPAGRGMTDTSDPSTTLASVESHMAVEVAAGRDLSRHRWRSNIWIEGGTPWAEFGWIGRTIRIGAAEAQVYKRIDRCMATAANPDTGKRDINLLDVLEDLGHQDFSVGLQITKSGALRTGDPVEVLQ